MGRYERPDAGLYRIFGGAFFGQFPRTRCHSGVRRVTKPSPFPSRGQLHIISTQMSRSKSVLSKEPRGRAQKPRRRVHRASNRQTTHPFAGLGSEHIEPRDKARHWSLSCRGISNKREGKVEVEDKGERSSRSPSVNSFHKSRR